MRLIAISSVLTGLFFGLTFGVMDLEDELVKSHYHMRHALQVSAVVPGSGVWWSVGVGRPGVLGWRRGQAVGDVTTGCGWDGCRAIRWAHIAFAACLQSESRICYPVGACAGTLSALAGQLLELRAEASDADLAYIRNARNDFL